jgi:hypothetical protein
MHPADTGSGARLVDAHVHIQDTRGLDAVAEAGVFTVRDAGTRHGAGLGIGNPAELRVAPVIVSAGRALWKKGGYGLIFGNPVETRSEIKSEILKLKREGAGIIKAMASGMVSLKEPGSITRGGFSRDELRFIVDEAAALGLGVMAHANAEPAIISAADAGVRSIEHGFFMTARALDMMAKKGIYWTPTVGALARAAETTEGSNGVREFVSGLISEHLKMMQHAYSIGVPLAVGTDCVLPDPRYRDAYDAELAYFEQAGISHDAAMKIAGEDGARLLGIFV